MQRTNRQLLRLFFLLVIVTALFGWWTVDHNWRAFTENLSLPSTGNTDWTTIISAFLENTIRFFQGATASSA